MIDRVAAKLREIAHLRTARGVLATPPVVPTAEGPVIFSMIGHRVLLPYLVAVKSFHARVGSGRIAILDDGTLTAADRALLARHLGDPDVRRLADVETGDCPRGGTWERLLTLLDLRRDDYVIQLDSDTVTVGDVAEIRCAIRDNASFTLLGDPETDAVGIQPLPAFRAIRYPEGAAAGRPHVQVALESRLDRYPDPARWRYVRGCSGFTGFARGGPSDRAAATAFSRNAATLVGEERWREWGTEQVTSSFLVANEPGTRPLPYARYLNYWNEAPPEDAAFLHFVGTHRYSTGAYRAATRAAIRSLRRAR